MYFVGIDLAWSDRNLTGICIGYEENNKLEIIDISIERSNQDIINFIEKNVENKSAIITIDSPIIVPNYENSRIAERELNKDFRKFNAGAHPANRKRLSSWTGAIRGEQLAKYFESKGYVQKEIDKNNNEPLKRVYEVFPHPANVSLFQLDIIFQYKAKQKRDYNFRYKEFRKYLNSIISLEETKDKPRMKIPDTIKNEKIENLIGKKLKKYEDKLDSILCSYIGYYYFKKPNNCKIYGNFKEGYILTPIK